MWHGETPTCSEALRCADDGRPGVEVPCATLLRVLPAAQRSKDMSVQVDIVADVNEVDR